MSTGAEWNQVHNHLIDTVRLFDLVEATAKGFQGKMIERGWDEDLAEYVASRFMLTSMNWGR